jgi:phosphatidylinositol-3-phosphatase
MRTMHIGRRGRALLAAASLIAGVAGIAAATGLVSAVPASAAVVAKPAVQSMAKKAAPPHVMTIMMENTDYSQFAGSPAMPYLNEIAHEYATFTHADGWTYPSLPNYLELLSGSDDGTAGSDCDITQAGCNNFTNPTLVTQLEKAGISWNAYYQGDPSGCYQGDGSGNYPYWHNAFRYFKDFSEQCSHITNFSHLLSNLSSPKASDFQWVVPDLDNSGGDSGTMSSGDSWLNGELPKIMDTSWYRQGGQIVILYDTGYNDTNDSVNGSTGGQIPMVVVSAHTKGMGAINTPVNTAGVLRSVEHAYGLSHIGNAANAKNGTLGNALISSRPVSSRPAAPVSQGAVLDTTGGTPGALKAVSGSLSINGVASMGTKVLEVGQNASGEGVVVAPGQPSRVVSGTGNLESVSCATSRQCYAVGLGALNSDKAVLVSIAGGKAVKVTDLPAFIGLYGIACPTTSKCYAVGYDNADDADAVTTITSGKAGAPVEVQGNPGEWLNAISCPSSIECYAVGLENYNPSFIPISSGTPGTPVTIPNAWYASGIDCTSVGNCVAVGENTTEQGIIGTLVNGKIGPTTVVKGTEYLYGVGCASSISCVITGAGIQASNGYSSGVVDSLTGGVPGKVKTVAHASGLGQVLSTGHSAYLTIGATYSA